MKNRAENLAIGAITTVWFGVLALGVVGWILNIAKIVWSTDDPVTALFIVRCVGVFLAPLGAVLGWF